MQLRSRVSLLVLLAAIALTISARAATHQVAIVDVDFVPRALTIQKGDTVVWIQEGLMPHTTTSGLDGVEDGVWDSGYLFLGDTFSHTFMTAGVFPYFCVPHLDVQRGVITVLDPGPEGPLLLSPERAEDGTFLFHVRGVAGRTYTIETSNDLQQWTHLTTVELAGESVAVEDHTAAGQAWRFYRARE
jgi:plastocyanin